MGHCGFTAQTSLKKEFIWTNLWNRSITHNTARWHLGDQGFAMHPDSPISLPQSKN